MTTARPMFPHAIDSSMLAAFRSCPQKMFRTYVEHWKPKAESVHLVAGAAFAKGVEVGRRAFFEGRVEQKAFGDVSLGQPAEYRMQIQIDPGDAELSVRYALHACMEAYGNFECPPESAKSLERTVGALQFYFDNYPLGRDGLVPLTFADGRKAIEFSFAQPLPVPHPMTGEPLLYTGRADLIGEFASGRFTVDEKTASQLGPTWSRQWELRSQFTGYQWAANKVGMDVQGTIVRGISILKTKYDTQQAITYRSPYEINRWLEQTCRDIERMIRCWQEGWWDYSLDHACTEYGGCSLARVCKSKDPETWLPMYFERKVWDPLAKRELSVDEWHELWGFRQPESTAAKEKAE